MTQKNISLESQISNLRNLLMGPDQQKHVTKYNDYSTKKQPLNNPKIKLHTYKIV